jgi:vitamin B12 transporter
MKNYFLFLFLIAASPAWSQTDSTVMLRNVDITSTRLDYNCGLYQETFDSASLLKYGHQSLDQLLEQNSAIAIKNYGPGRLSTITLRGGSSYQTAVMWNGFSIGSPLLGLSDLTLYRNLFFDNATIVYGGTSTLWGSGAVGGSVHLNNIPNFGSGLSVSAGISATTYSSLSEHLTLSYGGKKYYGSVKLTGTDNKNDYEFLDENNNRQRQVNSRVDHYGILSEHYLRTGLFSTMNVRIWNTHVRRLIPPGLQQVNSDAIQKDFNTRISGEWMKAKDAYRMIVRTAYFIEENSYDDFYLAEPSLNNCRTLINEATAEKELTTSHRVLAGINNSHYFTRAAQNLPHTDINSLSVFLLYKYFSVDKKLELSASARKEFSDIRNSPFVFSGGFNYYPLKSLLLRASVSTVYRNPTINDLYWEPGGNTELKPERGISADAGFEIRPFQKLTESSPSRIMLHGSAYYRLVDDWIIWYPSANTIWRPQNLSRVASRGGEFNISYNYSVKTFSAGIQLKNSYTVSTNEKAIRPMDESFQKQLIYVPYYIGKVITYFEYRSFVLNANVSYTGYQYTSSDNSTLLEGYTLLNAEISKSIPFGKNRLRIYFRANNILDENYQSVESHPMPLANYEAGVLFNFSTHKQK